VATDALAEVPIAAAATTNAAVDSRNRTGTRLAKAAQMRLLIICEKANVLAVNAAEAPGRPWLM
tara:strand:- start:327 stop:518 length:192 start_codon:yes stop_codon:yes gene_type:complete